ncbi:hypothetical protein CG716_06950 [Mycolicibacterium sphagni]|uniref:Uncharacterized protein n=1 Tax=Mycolicibacterium sphagni TaxID=1786 RepID=A0A255DPH1_9MYCO|nr:hypothetical protein CG716_06950 [Mycolicibacterium sphagni]
MVLALVAVEVVEEAEGESETAALLDLSLTADVGLLRLVAPVADFFGPASDFAESEALDEPDLPVSALATPWLAAAMAAPTPTATATPPT